MTDVVDPGLNTSAATYGSIKPMLGSVREDVLAVAERTGEVGITIREAVELTGRPSKTISPAFVQMNREGALVKAPRVRYFDEDERRRPSRVYLFVPEGQRTPSGHVSHCKTCTCNTEEAKTGD